MNDSHHYTVLTVVRILALVIVAYIIMDAYISIHKGEFSEGLKTLATSALGAVVALLANLTPNKPDPPEGDA